MNASVVSGVVMLVGMIIMVMMVIRRTQHRGWQNPFDLPMKRLEVIRRYLKSQIDAGHTGDQHRIAGFEPLHEADIGYLHRVCLDPVRFAELMGCNLVAARGGNLSKLDHISDYSVQIAMITGDFHPAPIPAVDLEMNSFAVIANGRAGQS